ncbi:MAG: cytidine deaminase [Cyclobacteriaceae bacterium]|jgi:cytidine deaminase
MELKVEFSYQKLTLDKLEQRDQALFEKAEQALQYSHSPYSQFKVACAIRLTNGVVITGSNQENASYPAGLCAERVALYAAKSSQSSHVETMIIIARKSSGESADANACGNCRQVMVEYASLQSDPIRVLMQQSDQAFIQVNDAKELLPFHFNSDALR